jgi:hypothetical protein
MRWAGYVARVREKGKTYKDLVEKSEVKRPFGRPRLSLDDIIKM